MVCQCTDIRTQNNQKGVGFGDDHDEFARELQILEDRTTRRVWQILDEDRSRSNPPPGGAGDYRQHSSSRPHEKPSSSNEVALGKDGCQLNAQSGIIPCKTCKGACSGNAYCRSQQAPRCVCAASSQVGMDRGVFRGSCGMIMTGNSQLGSLSRGGRKRSDIQEVANGLFQCACNSSYVSGACCDSNDGLVWEDPDFFLGKLVEE